MMKALEIIKMIGLVFMTFYSLASLFVLFLILNDWFAIPSMIGQPDNIPFSERPMYIAFILPGFVFMIWFFMDINDSDKDPRASMMVNK